MQSLILRLFERLFKLWASGMGSAGHCSEPYPQAQINYSLLFRTVGQNLSAQTAIISGATIQFVMPPASDQRIRAVFTPNHVIACAVEKNVLTDPGLPHFHARTEFDNVRPEAVDELKRWFLKEGHLFHNRMREIVSKYDQDVNPDGKFKGRGIRVVFSAFSFMDKEDDE